MGLATAPKYTQRKINWQFKLKNFIFFNINGNIADLTQAFWAWKKALVLFYNLYYYNQEVAYFTNVLFAKEGAVLSTNFRQFKDTKRKLWPNSFFFSSLSYNQITDQIFVKVADSGLQIAVITDTNTHKRTIHFLQKIHTFTIGITSLNSQPWDFSFSIPAISNSFLSQFTLFNLSLVSYRLAAVHSLKNNLQNFKQLCNFL
jgi:hypothetical protein